MTRSVGNLYIRVRYRTASGPKERSFHLEGINSTQKIDSVELYKSIYSEEVIMHQDYRKSNFTVVDGEEADVGGRRR